MNSRLNIAADERNKYVEIWQHPEYHKYSPGHKNVSRFLDVMKPPPHSTIIDLGCGEGGAGLELKQKGFDVTWLDLVRDALDPAISHYRFIESALWDSKWPLHNRMKWDYGFCCDVLEHLPTELTMLAIANILSACRVTWFHIALRPDDWGKLIDKPLHLTVQSYEWWLSRISAIGKVTDARDLCGEGLYVVSQR